LFVYIGKNPQFMAFLDRNLHTRLAIVTENELGLAFPPRNLPKKFLPDPSTLYLVIVVTNRQTHRQTNAGKNIIPHFCGDKYPSPLLCQGHKSGDNINIAVLHLSPILIVQKSCFWGYGYLKHW